jgi:hypothetical protein
MGDVERGFVIRFCAQSDSILSRPLLMSNAFDILYLQECQSCRYSMSGIQFLISKIYVPILTRLLLNFNVSNSF